MTMFNPDKYLSAKGDQSALSVKPSLQDDQGVADPVNDQRQDSNTASVNVSINGPLSKIYATALLKLFKEKGSNLVEEAMSADGTTLIIDTKGTPEEVVMFVTDTASTDINAPLETAKKLTLALDNNTKSKLLVVENIRGSTSVTHLIEYAESLPNTKVMFSRQAAFDHIKGLVR